MNIVPMDLLRDRATVNQVAHVFCAQPSDTMIADTKRRGQKLPLYQIKTDKVSGMRPDAAVFYDWIMENIPLKQIQIQGPLGLLTPTYQAHRWIVREMVQDALPFAETADLNTNDRHAYNALRIFMRRLDNQCDLTEVQDCLLNLRRIMYSQFRTRNVHPYDRVLICGATVLDASTAYGAAVMYQKGASLSKACARMRLYRLLGKNLPEKLAPLYYQGEQL